MSTLSKQLVALFAVIIFSMAMYGCGGGGSSGPSATTTPDPDPMPDPMPMTHDVTLPSGVATMEGMAEIAAGASGNIGDITFTCPAGGDDCSVEVAADGTATSTGGAATAAESQASMDRATTAARVEAMRIAALIGPDATPADYDGDQDENNAIVTLTEQNAADAGKTAVAGVIAFQEDELATEEDANRFVKSGYPATISGWEGATYTRTNDMTVHTVVKYNNKEDDGSEDYATYFGEAGRPGVTGTADTTTPGQLILATAADTGSHELFSLNFGLTAPLQTIPASQYDDPDMANTQHDNPDTETEETSTSWTGMFAGVPGTFTCSGDFCAVSSDDEGNLSSLAGEWTFRPAGSDMDGNAETDELDDIMVHGVVPDADFMIFGYWEQAVTDEEGKTTYSMLPIADGKRDYPDDMSNVVGIATYTGPATGLYMKKSLTPDGQPTDPFTSGQFTASATLNASFGGGEIADNHQFSITGTISSFMDGGNPINDQWVVNLNRRMLGTGDAARPQQNIGAADNTSHSNGTGGSSFSGVTDGGPLGSAVGSWSGQFHGAAGANNAQPVSATGMFDGHFSNGHVRGAFAVD